MYLKGQGITKNKEQAIFWLQKAAEQGHEDAQEILSEMQLGNSTEKITVSINISSSLLKRDEATQNFEDMF
jgi:TPR repeat protein